MMARPQQGKSGSWRDEAVCLVALLKQRAGALFKHLLGDDMDMKTDEAPLNTEHPAEQVNNSLWFFSPDYVICAELSRGTGQAAINMVLSGTSGGSLYQTDDIWCVWVP